MYWAALALRDTVIWELAIDIVELTNKQNNQMHYNVGKLDDWGWTGTLAVIS